MSKKYSCCYCGERYDKVALVKHLEKEHDDELPPHYTPYRMAYDIINNKKGHGSCCICHADTQWNEKRQKYNRLCGNPECSKKVREIYKTRMLKVYGKVHLLDDPQHQEKMLAHRHISGKYRWSDGTLKTYTGSYEKELMEFLDKTLDYKSNEVLAPGPILEYQIKGKTRHWITDFLILPYNLIIEVKDGGDNPNKRSMPEYRAKQYAKEKMITNMGVYSYLRLTNKDFSQLLGILAELKMKAIDDDDSPLFRIHEAYNIIEKEFQETPLIEEIIPDAYNCLESIPNLPSIDRLSKIADIEYSEYFNENAFGDCLFELIHIHPKLVNQNAFRIFDESAKRICRNLKSICDNDTIIESYWIDPENHSEGIGIGILL